MQGDLIRKTELLESLNDWIDENTDINTILRWIEEFDIAYDVEVVVAEMNKLINEELHSVLKPLPDGTEYPEEAYRLLYLNTRLRGLIRNGGKE